MTQQILPILEAHACRPGKRFAGGAVLYDGDTCASFGDDLFAAPLRLLWEID